MTPEARRAKPLPIALEPLSLADLSGGDNLLQTGFWGVFKAASDWKPQAFRWRAGIPGGDVDPRAVESNSRAGKMSSRAGESSPCTGESSSRAGGSVTGDGNPGSGSGAVAVAGESGAGSTVRAEGRLLVLEKRFPAGLTLAYVPYGPSLASCEPSVAGPLLEGLARALESRLSPGCFLIRFDLAVGTGAPVSEAADLPSPGPLPPPARRAPYRVQPPDTVVLPLADSEGTPLAEDAILAGMHKKTRYNIRLAGKKGVEVRRYRGPEALEALPGWYALYEETGRRDGIALHPESYYRRLLGMPASEAGDVSGVDPEGVGEAGSALPAAPEFSLYMAFHEDEALAGIIVSRCGRRSTYMYGASSSKKRELMPNYLLQWRAIADALAEGAVEYDFFGIPPANDPSHPMHGLWRFKTGFGGEIRHYLGAWDYPLKPLAYRGYALAETLRGALAAFRKRGR